MILEQQGYAWDRARCPGAVQADLDPDKIRRFIGRARTARNVRLDPSAPLSTVLETLELLVDGSPNYAAILLFGRDPQRFLDQAEVRCARFRGDSPADPFVSMRVIGGDLMSQIDEAEAFLLGAMDRAAWVTDQQYRREEQWEYPPDAVREAVINALCHRDYQSSGNVQIRLFDTALEVWSPGRLPAGITIPMLKGPHISRPRNRLIARLLFMVSYIERWGSGITRMIERCREEGSADPGFSETGEEFVVRFVPSMVNQVLRHPDLLNERQRRVIEYLRHHGTIGSGAYARELGVTDRTARTDLAQLVTHGVVVTEGKGKTTVYRLREPFRKLPDLSGSPGPLNDPDGGA